MCHCKFLLDNYFEEALTDGLFSGVCVTSSSATPPGGRFADCFMVSGFSKYFSKVRLLVFMKFF